MPWLLCFHSENPQYTLKGRLGEHRSHFDTVQKRTYLVSTRNATPAACSLVTILSELTRLPSNIKMLSKDIKHFKSSLRTYLTEHAFYSTGEYYQLSS
jgi:hypothetical protein